jgi:hypothetical protein
MIINEQTNLDQFWLTQDSLSMTTNLYFGLGKSYFCGHGCKMCNIRDELNELTGKTARIYNNDIDAMIKSWDEVKTFFSTIALDEDPYYFKFNHPKEYEWYKKYSSQYSYGTSDNGIFRVSKLKDIKFKSIFEVTISISFAETVNPKKLIDALEKLLPIERIKLLINKEGEYPAELTNWIKQNNVPVILHKIDFYTGVETDFVSDLKSENVDWVVGRKGDEFVKIHINSDVILYYNNFYFSNNVKDAPYFTMSPDGFDYKKFLSSLLEGKQNTYKIYAGLVDDIYLKNYFLNTQNYKVNHDYNFIPNFMINYKIKFFNRMKELGWNATKHGLIYGVPNEVIPIIEKI